jgi:H+/Cl- antiporter ClcA
VGGLLFAFEEVASFWQQSLGWQIFFCCMCGVFASGLMKVTHTPRSAFELRSDGLSTYNGSS